MSTIIISIRLLAQVACMASDFSHLGEDISIDKCHLVSGNDIHKAVNFILQSRIALVSLVLFTMWGFRVKLGREGKTPCNIYEWLHLQYSTLFSGGNNAKSSYSTA